MDYKIRPKLKQKLRRSLAGPVPMQGYIVFVGCVQWFVSRTQGLWRCYHYFTGCSISGMGHTTRKTAIEATIADIEQYGGVTECEKRASKWDVIN